jgi:hypothetical protein
VVWETLACITPIKDLEQEYITIYKLSTLDDINPPEYLMVCSINDQVYGSCKNLLGNQSLYNSMRELPAVSAPAML